MSTSRASLIVLSLAVTSIALTAQTPAWVQRQVTTPLGQCGSPWLVYDAARKETLLSTGYSCAQTWTWNGSVWTQETPTTLPGNDYRTGCYDASRQCVVMVVGNQSTGLRTWEWDGSNWLLRATGGLPARGGFSMVFDAAHDKSLLFGGNGGDDYHEADMWAWNGASWTQVSNGGPTPRSGASMTYDAARGRVVLFGGQGPMGDTEVSHGDTWEWNGSYWYNHFGLAGPPPRRYAPMIYDSHRQRVVLFGGGTSSGGLTDTWEWNGSAWTQRFPIGNPGTWASGLVYDSERGVMMTRTNHTSPQTWEYVDDSGAAATYAPYGAGCAGPVGVPQLANVAGSVPRIGSTLQLQVTNLPGSPLNAVIGAIGFDATEWNGSPLPLDLSPLGFTGCDLWLAPAITSFVSNSNGMATWDVLIPMNSFYLGVHVYFQALVLVPGWNPAGFVFSNAGHGVMGSP